MIYGYARCSTSETRQNIDRQLRELLSMGVKDKDSIFFEYESGTKIDRTQFNKLLQSVSNGDTICSTEVSRITRSMKQLLEILDLAKEKKLKLVLGSFVVDFNTTYPDPMTLATIQLMGVFSELEKNMISERVKSGMANAREKGKQIGRQEVTINDIPKDFIKYYELYKNKQINKVMLSSLSKISYPTCLKYIKMLKKQLIIY